MHDSRDQVALVASVSSKAKDCIFSKVLPAALDSSA